MTFVLDLLRSAVHAAAKRATVQKKTRAPPHTLTKKNECVPEEECTVIDWDAPACPLPPPPERKLPMENVDR